MYTLTIIGRRWFQRTYGNTYHSAEVVLDGKTILNTGHHYGYGDQYVYTALESLAAWNDLQPPSSRIDLPERASNGGWEALWQWAERTGINYSARAIDVARERDL